MPANGQRFPARLHGTPRQRLWRRKLVLHVGNLAASARHANPTGSAVAHRARRGKRMSARAGPAD